MPPLRLLEPTADLLDRYAGALRHGFVPDGAAAAMTELRQLEANPRDFVRNRLDRPWRAPPAAGFRLHRWAFDVVACDFVGLVQIRADVRLAASVRRLAGVRVAIVPWWRRRGYGTAALELVRAWLHSTGLQGSEVGCHCDDAVAMPSIQTQPAVPRAPIAAHHWALRHRITVPAALAVDAAA